LVADFLSLCESLAYNNPTRAREVLQVFGYGPDLSKAEPSDQIIDKLKEKAQKLPRYILSNNKEYIEILFTLLSKSKNNEIELKGKVSDAALNLLFRLPASKELLNKVLKIPKEADNLIKAPIFSSDTPYESIYLLFLAALTFFDVSDGDVSQLRNELPLSDCSTWITGFLTKKGFTWATNTLMSLKGKAGDDGMSVYLIALLNIIEAIVMTFLGKYLNKPLEIYEDESMKVLRKGPAEIINVGKSKPKQKSIYLPLSPIEIIRSRLLIKDYLSNFTNFSQLLSTNEEILSMSSEKLKALSNSLLDLMAELLKAVILTLHLNRIL